MALLAVLSCELKHDQCASITIDYASTVTFDLGFPVVWNQIGTLPDQRSGEPSYYFSNTTSAKELLRFDAHGRLLQRVDLGRSINSLRSVSHVLMISVDTILLLGGYGREFVLVDRGGEVLTLHSLSDQLRDSLGNNYELAGSVSGNIKVQDGIIFNSYYSGLYGFLDDDGEQNELAFYRGVGHAAHLALLSDFATAPRVTFLHYNYYFNSNPANDTFPRLWTEAPQYVCSGTHVFEYSAYSPWVHKLDTRTGRLDSILVTSQFGPAHVALPRLDSTEIVKGQELINQRLQRSGRILNVLPLDPDGKILVILGIFHGGDGRGGILGTGDWAAILYSETGTKLCESRFSGKEHTGGIILQEGERILVKRASTLTENRAGKLSFDVMIVGRP